VIDLFRPDRESRGDRRVVRSDWYAVQVDTAGLERTGVGCVGKLFRGMVAGVYEEDVSVAGMLDGVAGACILSPQRHVEGWALWFLQQLDGSAWPSVWRWQDKVRRSRPRATRPADLVPADLVIVNGKIVTG